MPLTEPLRNYQAIINLTISLICCMILTVKCKCRSAEVTIQKRAGGVCEFGRADARAGEVETALYNRQLGEHVMKKVLFSGLILLVVSWSCVMVFAQEKGKARGPRGRSIPTRKGRADANETSKSVRGKQTQPGKRTQEQEKWQKMEQKVKDDLKALEGKGVDHQLEVVNTKITQEEAKHMRRAARLARIRELAVEEGKTDIVERVDKLRQKETQRYAKKYGILKSRKYRLAQGKPGRHRIPTKAERERRRKKRERDRESSMQERGSRSKESATDSNDG